MDEAEEEGDEGTEEDTTEKEKRRNGRTKAKK